MNVERQLPALRRKLECVERQEEQTWANFYPQARRDVMLAEEILTELERDDLLRRRHRGLYLSCQRCVRLHELRHTRNQHVGRVVRAVVRRLFITGPQALCSVLRQAGQLFMACLPQEEAQESGAPWSDQARRLLERDAYTHGGQALRVRARKAAEKAAEKAAGKAEVQLQPGDAGASRSRTAHAMAKTAVG